MDRVLRGSRARRSMNTELSRRRHADAQEQVRRLCGECCRGSVPVPRKQIGSEGALADLLEFRALAEGYLLAVAALSARHPSVF